MDPKKICPVCGQYEFEEPDFYEVCPICGWEDDLVQRLDPDFEGGANTESLNQARASWKAKLNEEALAEM